MTRHVSLGISQRTMGKELLVLLLIVTWTEAASAPAGSVTVGPCRLSETTCTSANVRHRCVPLSRFCDGVDDCGDGSDEPRSCTPCNRTYYGDLGKTYQLAVHRPREDRLPFVCDLTFRAPGGTYGDFVQLTFDSFTLGRFTSWTQAGCPDGDLQISENVAERPQVGGRWCGTAWGPPALYYSETGSVTLHLRLNRLHAGGGNAIPIGGGSSASMGYNFDFSVGFKVLSRESAIVRYGSQTSRINSTLPIPGHPETTYHLGDLIPGTYCSRIYSDCDTKLCRLQSPNFPGVYPRNVTCYYAVRQHEVPPGTHALISVSQPSGQMISVRSRGALPSASRSGENNAAGEAGRSSGHRIKVWKECDEVQDYITVYDGYTTRDPVLMRFCGGGQSVPAAVSSGPELLVEFTSSPYGTFLAPPAAMDQSGQASFQPGGLGGALHGFELQIEVKFVPLHTPTYARNKRCEFWIRQSTEPLPNGRSDTGGRLENPAHSLAPNTTCVYHISAAEGTSRVWVSLLRFHTTSALDPSFQDEKCTAELRIWDGDLAASVAQNCDSGPFCERPRFPMSVTPNPGPGMPSRNASLLARYCKDLSDRSCEHILLSNSSRSPRPCRPGQGAEGFVSSGATITLELRLGESSALRPVRFSALYEFVDPRQDGEQLGPGPCDRKFSSRGRSGPAAGLLPFRDLRDNSFRSPRDIFLYGRGGAKNLRCRYRFEAEAGERVKLTITRLSTGPGLQKCHSVLDPALGRHRCVGANYTARIVVHEVPWPHDEGGSVLVPRECACSPDAAPLVYVSTGAAVELILEANNMPPYLDYDDILLEGRFEFIATPPCTKSRKVTGPSGEIRVRSPSATPDEVNCANYPWLLEPGSGKFLYVKLKGHQVPDPPPLSASNASEMNNVISTSVPPCLTRNRLVVYSSGELRAIVCPLSSRRTSTVEVFSIGWEGASIISRNSSTGPQDEKERRLVVEFVAREPGSYSVSWLEVEPLRRMHGPAVLPPAGYVMNGEKEGPLGMHRLDHCAHRCPELAACINASLFCDGQAHCPSGYDEASEFCAPYFLRLPQLLYVALAAAGLIALCAALFVGGFRPRCKRRRKQSRMKLLLPPGSAGKDLAIC